jgi:hypothetical protein
VIPEMKKGLLILLGILLVSIAAQQISIRCFRSTPTQWLCHEYGLSAQQAERMKVLQSEYGARCGPFCDQMCEANANLETVALGSGSITPEVRAAVVETDRIRTETRIAMLKHFYAVAAELPAEKRRAYLLKVLPLVIDSCGMQHP